jgi:predicted enzyme related to lactoylglutathione lyase
MRVKWRKRVGRCVVVNGMEGRFVWADLTTRDSEAAGRFYAELLGWELDRDESDMGVYLIGEIDGGDAAGMMAQSPDQAEMPPMWTIYLASDHLEDTLQRVVEHGGRAVVPPFDIPGGRIAIAADPTGGTFAIAQWPGEGGFEVYGKPGAVCWAELLTRDVETAVRFYSAVFGWEARTDPSETGGTYTTFSRAGEQMLGVLPIPEMVPSGAPAFWQIYFLVDDLDAAVVAATDRGASVLVPKMQIGEHAWFATLQDPQGAGFSLFAGDM